MDQQQPPSRNASVIGAQVYSHNGEFAPQVFDCALPARGVSFQFVRKYRSANAGKIGPLGRGWTFTYAKSLEKDGGGLIYHDGFGRTFFFPAAPNGQDFLSPDGFYAVLEEADEWMILRQRHGKAFVFERPEAGGRLLHIQDRYGNILRFDHAPDGLTAIDTFGRNIMIGLDKGLVTTLDDGTGRRWQYNYDSDARLVAVVGPAGTTVRYSYNTQHRLASITDPKGQTFLTNTYDDQGRVVRQAHGNGVYLHEYEPIGETPDGLPIYQTSVVRKNGSRLVLLHNEAGHVVERTLAVNAEHLAEIDRAGQAGGQVALVTQAKYNRHGEQVWEQLPAGDQAERVFDENNADPRARGNLLEAISYPASELPADQPQLRIRYEYEPYFQMPTLYIDQRDHVTQLGYDDRGSLVELTYPEVTTPEPDSSLVSEHKLQPVERFHYNDGGQRIRSFDPEGRITEFIYYSEEDPTGASGDEAIESDPNRIGGLLARVVRDPDGAAVQHGFRYDRRGHLVQRLDGNHNPTELLYDERDRLTGIVSRAPLNHMAEISYDENDNPVEVITTFERNEFDPTTGQVIPQTTTLTQKRRYNLLNNIVAVSIEADGRELTTTYERDENENVLRVVRPLGNIIEQRYDERNLPIEQRFGVGEPEECVVHFAYTPNGRQRTYSDGADQVTQFDYDGFHRYLGYTNPIGTVKRQQLDAAGNVVGVEISGLTGEDDAARRILSQAAYHYDELNRLLRIDQGWFDPLTGQTLGSSSLDSTDGQVSAILTYSANGLPAAIHLESGNRISLSYDGANRLTAAEDVTGETVHLSYDANGNPVRLERIGPPPAPGEARVEQVLHIRYDELDRPVALAVNDDPPVQITLNPLGATTTVQNQADARTTFLHDSFGRLSGRATTAITPEEQAAGQAGQLIVSQLEWDDNDRVVAATNAANHMTQYRYDALGRTVEVIYPDDTRRRFGYDAADQLNRILDANGNDIRYVFDGAGRPARREIRTAAGETLTEQYHYDGANRLLRAASFNGVLVYRYDSLGRLLLESWNDQAVTHTYDSAGNCMATRYPGGLALSRSYDSRGRLTELYDDQGRRLAAYSYRSGNQLRELLLGDTLQVTYEYEPGKAWLRSILYRSLLTGEIVTGNRYTYDVVGNRLQEEQLRHGPGFGDRYSYDSANRLYRVQYGVEQLADPNSPFAREVRYTLSPLATWQQRTTRDGAGQVVEQIEGQTNARDLYLELGSRRFTYDANGYRLEETDQADGSRRRHTYDFANRLVRLEIENGDGTGKIIEYDYDLFGRQVSRRLIENGQVKVIDRVWNGTRLLEEWDDGKLARRYIYGERTVEPLQMVILSDEEEQTYSYAGDAWGATTALIGVDLKVKEGYSYDASGQASVTEVDGEVLAPPAETSKMENPLLLADAVTDSEGGYSFAPGMTIDPRVGGYIGPYPGDWYQRGQSLLPKAPDNEDYEASIGAHAAVIGILLLTPVGGGLLRALGLKGKTLHTVEGVLHLGWEVGWEIYDHYSHHENSGNSSAPTHSATSPQTGGGTGYSDYGVGHSGNAPQDAHPAGEYTEKPKSQEKPESEEKSDSKDSNSDIEVDENGNWYDKRTGERGGPNDKMPNPEGGTDEGPSLPWQQVNVGPNNFWEVVSELFGSRDSQDPEQPDTPWSFFTPQEWSEISAVFGPRSGDEPADERPAKPWEEFANRDLFSMDSGGWNDWYSGSADWAYLKFGAPRVRTERSTARF